MLRTGFVFVYILGCSSLGCQTAPALSLLPYPRTTTWGFLCSKTNDNTPRDRINSLSQRQSPSWRPPEVQATQVTKATSRQSYRAATQTAATATASEVLEDGFEVLVMTSPEAVRQFFLCCRENGIASKDLLILLQQQQQQTQQQEVLVAAVGQRTADVFLQQLHAAAAPGAAAASLLGRQNPPQTPHQQQQEQQQHQQPAVCTEESTAATTAADAGLATPRLFVPTDASGVSLAKQLRAFIGNQSTEATTTATEGAAPVFRLNHQCRWCKRPLCRVLWPSSALADDRFAKTLLRTTSSTTSNTGSCCCSREAICWRVCRYDIYTTKQRSLTLSQREQICMLLSSRCLLTNHSNSSRCLRINNGNNIINNSSRKQEDLLGVCGAAVMFGSPSAVSAWADTNRLPVVCPGNSNNSCECLSAVCIGATTAAAARKAGFRRVVFPAEPGLRGWLRCLYTSLGRPSSHHQGEQHLHQDTGVASVAASGILSSRYDSSSTQRPLVFVTRGESQASELLELLFAKAPEVVSGLSVIPSTDGAFDLVYLPLIETFNQGDKQQQQRAKLGQLLSASINANRRDKAGYRDASKRS